VSDTTTNRYLEGVFAPVHEELTAFDLPVTGTIPAELDGRYLRNGPNPIGPVDPANHHWFTGNGMVHGVRMRDGRAEWYRNRWIRSTEVAAALGEEPAPGDRNGGNESANTNVIGLAGRTYAIVEAGGRPVELTDELDTICFSDFDGTLAHGFTAHPKRDPRTGELHAVNYFWARPNVLDYTVVGADGRVTHQVDIAVPGNPMTHDCSITETTLAVYDLPVTFNLDLAMGGSTLPYGWDPDYGARVGLLPLHGTGDQVQWFDVGPCYVYHPVNAFDDGPDRVVIDVVRHPAMFATDRLGPNDGTPALWRWTFDRVTGKVAEEQLDDRALELPRVDERLVGRPHRYSWAMGLHTAAGNVDFGGTNMVRYDRTTGDAIEVDFGPGRTGGELVFVPRADDAAEDDGWYLTYVDDQTTGRADLVILDASAPDQDPVALVHLPGRIPVGFHGNWVPTTS
jgi:carotenoid cleavage dioxygenase